MAAEVTVLPPDCLLEDKRLSRVSFLEALNEREKTFLDCLYVWIGECIEYVGIGIHIGKDIGKIRLHLAVPAAAKGKHLDAGMAGQLPPARSPPLRQS